MEDTSANKISFITIYDGLQNFKLSLYERIMLSLITKIGIYYGSYQSIKHLNIMSERTYWRTIDSLIKKGLIYQLPYEIDKTKKRSYKSLCHIGTHNNKLYYDCQSGTQTQTECQSGTRILPEWHTDTARVAVNDCQSGTHNNKGKENKGNSKGNHARDITKLLNSLSNKLQEIFNTFINYLEQEENKKVSNVRIITMLKEFINYSKKYNEIHLITLINEMISEKRNTIYYDRLEKIKNRDRVIDLPTDIREF